MNLLRRIFGRDDTRTARPNGIEKNVPGCFRRCRFESMEDRRVLAANPLELGAVYIEGDGGTDAEPDQFYLYYQGGSPTTSISKIVIDGDQDGNLSLGDTDVYFDVLHNSNPANRLGVGDAHGFQWSPKSVGIHPGEITASVTDGGTRLTLDLVGFEAGDLLAFTIDVDQFFSSKPHDQVTSGIEFSGSSLQVSAWDSRYTFSPDPAVSLATFDYSFDFGADDLDDTGRLSTLPSQFYRKATHGFQSIENRTAGGLIRFSLDPRASSLSGHVGLADATGYCVDPLSPAYQGLSGVMITAEDSAGQKLTTLTNANGFYEFNNLAPGTYTLSETQPTGLLDGQESLGTVNGVSRGLAVFNDQFTNVVLNPGEQGVNYNFGELQESTLTGRVHTDINENGLFDPQIGEQPLTNVLIQLIGHNQQVIQHFTTDASGEYRFEGLHPGSYSIKQTQPSSYFSVGESIGIFRDSGLPGDGVVGENLISSITVAPGTHRIHYNFFESPAATISGFVFQDGEPITLQAGETLSNDEARALRDGQLTADDIRLAGVSLELRHGITGLPITAESALPGIYPNGPIQVKTNSNGFYEFTGLKQGNYGVFEIQPAGFRDHVDTQGTNLGIPVNPTDEINPTILSTLDASVDPANDAILRIALNWGDNAQRNNFSELATDAKAEIPLQPSSTPLTLAAQTAPVFVAQEWVYPALTRTSTVVISGLAAPPSDTVTYSWHLSILNGGAPRGDQGAETQWQNISYLTDADWDGRSMDRGVWQISQQTVAQIKTTPKTYQVPFGMEHGIPLSGDFDGNGTDELLIYLHGFWFVDLNGNRQWDRDDLWAKLGTPSDLPVVGDWDGDGKDDIGIFGPQWPNDLRAIDCEPGLPDLANSLSGPAKNTPPEKEKATSGYRKMKSKAKGSVQNHLIDHVFHFGSNQEWPVCGDWNGDGVRNIGTFKDGTWKLDINGDGRLTSQDRSYEFGQEGDLPVVGDFNGDGIEQIGVYRAGTWLIDSNANGALEATDKVFKLGTVEDVPVVGDFNGDGLDEPAVYNIPAETQNSSPKILDKAG
ncbi:MAG: SdrD B-like domain-containing protein [Planctomycetota bacterium]|nr:SdrD B-like domain-containing protein [Planctomycetota bacterium]